MTGEAGAERRLWEIGGADRIGFLQGLVTSDVRRLEGADGIVYAALLTPQGKYLADFFLVRTGGRLVIDLPEGIAEATMKRLAMYRLRADVSFAPSLLHVARGTGAPPPGAFADPRHPGLGWRAYTEAPPETEAEDWEALRIALGVPGTGAELVANDTYILEAGFDRLGGVDFRKGCYVGQEVTARMRHKTELRKGFVPVAVEGAADAGVPVLTAEGREAGVLTSVRGGLGIAYLRFDRADGALTAGGARIALREV